MLTLCSWNVNGIRAAARKGMLSWLKSFNPDILCVQEIKAMPDQLSKDIREPDGYTSFWEPAQKKGYSGVALYTRQEPVSITNLGEAEFDCEGRVQVIEYTQFTLVNTYFPNSRDAGSRLDYKLGFCKSIKKACDKLVRLGKNVIICGDFNIAHTPIDLTNPKANEGNAGYLPEEREWMTGFIKSGWVDTFRMFNTLGGHYTWWSYRFKAREKNIGWRIDYHCVNTDFAPWVQASIILPDVMGSDHCPVCVKIRL